MNLNLKGKNAVVCGSSQGLGFASAVELALLGANVTLLARNEERLKSAVQQLDTSNGQQHGYLVADFSQPESVLKVAQEFLHHIKTVHILVNNTGGPASGPILDAEAPAFRSAFDAHLICNHYLATTFIPGMREANYGRIVNIISTSVKQPLKNLGVSNTIRAAVANWSKTLANEVAKWNITVNNVLPGLTKTTRADYIVQKQKEITGKSEDEIIQGMVAEIPMGRMGNPEDFGAAVAFLCSPSASYITGINLPVDGGRTGCL